MRFARSTSAVFTMPRGLTWGFWQAPFARVTRSVLGILFTFWVMGFLIYKQKGCFFLPWGTGTKVKGTVTLETSKHENAVVLGLGSLGHGVSGVAFRAHVAPHAGGVFSAPGVAKLASQPFGDGDSVGGPCCTVARVCVPVRANGRSLHARTMSNPFSPFRKRAPTMP